MLRFKTKGTLDDTQDRLSRFMSRGEFDQALQLYIENRKQIPLLRRRFYFLCIGDGLSGHKSYRRIFKTAVIMLIVNFLIQPVFSIQFLDLFAFLSQRFLYYNYFTSLLPNILNVFFMFGLVLQWHSWVTLPRRLFDRSVESAYGISFMVLITLVSLYISIQIIPLAKDLPMVIDGRCFTRYITEEEVIAMVYGQIIHSTDRKDVASSLRQELHDKYGWDYDTDNYPVHYFKRGKDLLGREVNLIYLDEEKEYFTMSRLQFKATVYDDNTYPIIIKYLSNSKTILQILNE